MRRPSRSGVRYRQVDPGESESMLAAVLALETRVYEPARRDSAEKLGLAFRDPDGVAIVAELQEGDQWTLVGCALGAPLEHASKVAGPDRDPMRRLNNTMYVIAVTTDPAHRGYGIGRHLKEEMLRAAATRTDKHGASRYLFCSGRQRVGAAEVMMRINQSLGASQVFLLDNQYGEDAQAWYYRQPVGGFRPARITPPTQPRNQPVAFRLGQPLLAPPASLHRLYLRGGLFGPLVHDLKVDLRRQTTATLRAIEWFQAMDPDRQTLQFFSNEEAVRRHLAGRTLIHTVDCETGEPRTLVEQDEGIAVDKAAALNRCGAPNPDLPRKFSRLWIAPGFCCLQQPGPAKLAFESAISEFALVFVHHLLRWAQSAKPAAADKELIGALAPLLALPGVTRQGRGLYQVVKTSAAPRIGAGLLAQGFEIDYDAEYLRFAPPLDFDRWSDLRAAIEACVP